MFRSFDKIVENFFDALPRATYTYELKYNWGGWNTFKEISAKFDDDAISIADKLDKQGLGEIEYALFKGNKIIKRYK